MSNERLIPLALVLMLSASGCGNGGAASGQASSSGQPAASGAPAAAPGGGKTTRFKHVQDECTFELDVPEALKQTDKDGMSTTYKGPTVWFQGFAGTANYGLKGLVGLTTMGGSPPPTYQGTANGVNLVIGSSPKAPPENAVMGHGEEESIGSRSVGCSFLCGGTKAREAELIAMCKSVRITVDTSKLK